jgi:hypothetical protein
MELNDWVGPLSDTVLLKFMCRSLGKRLFLQKSKHGKLLVMKELTEGQVRSVMETSEIDPQDPCLRLVPKRTAFKRKLHISYWLQFTAELNKKFNVYYIVYLLEKFIMLHCKSLMSLR